MEISKKNTVVVGLGASGFSCIDYLLKQSPVETVVVVDTREAPPRLSEFKQRYPNIPVYTGKRASAIMAVAETLVLSPGISREDPAIVATVRPHVSIIGDIELFARATNAAIVAITGSNGKSTVTTLVGEMAKKAGMRVGVGGNLGTPALTLLDERSELYVLELSSFQLETTHSLKSTVATILNLSPDHLDRYSHVDKYYAAKHRIFQTCERIVVNRGDAYVRARVPTDRPWISFGVDNPVAGAYGILLGKQPWIAKGEQCILPLSALKVFGRHNIENVLAALALGDAIELPIAAMLEVLSSFTGLRHRCEWIREWNGIQWINDSKGTNVAATCAVLEGLAGHVSGKWVLIAGGVGKKADFSPLKPVISRQCRAVILIGETTEELYSLLQTSVYCLRASDMEEAVHLASQQALPGDGVLLSPACASFDMFRDFEERGDCFRELVCKLKI